MIKPTAHISGMCVFPFSFSITYICCETPKPLIREQGCSDPAPAVQGVWSQGKLLPLKHRKGKAEAQSSLLWHMGAGGGSHLLTDFSQITGLTTQMRS